MHYYLILALQGFCIYHALKNGKGYYWVMLIFFIPVLGGIIYLITQVYNKRDANIIQDEITSILIPSKRVKDLERRLEFSETYQNKINLADAYFEMKDYDNAVIQYEITLEDKSQSNLHSIKQLIVCYFETNDYKKVIRSAEKIKNHSEFKCSNAQFILGLALNEEGEIEAAEKELRQIDLRYSNYNERLVLAQFLQDNNKTEDAKNILNEILIESEHMTKPNRKLYKSTIIEAQKTLNTI